MNRLVLAVPAIVAVATGCAGGSTIRASNASAPHASASSSAAASTALPQVLQGIYDGTLSASAAASTAPHIPTGKLVMQVDANGFGILAADGKVYADGAHSDGRDQFIATVEPGRSAGDPHPVGRFGCAGPGTYRWSYSATTAELTVTAVSDTCVDRRLLLAGRTWHTHGAP